MLLQPASDSSSTLASALLLQQSAGQNSDTRVHMTACAYNSAATCCANAVPGTGKTSTIVHAVRALVASGASVLVTSYTNSALDNILLKLVGAGLHDFVRLGRQGSCHPALHEYMPGGAR
jgi:hypothetical protein